MGKVVRFVEQVLFLAIISAAAVAIGLAAGYTMAEMYP